MPEKPLNLEIDDPENYSSSERLKHIYEARRHLREMRTEASIHRSDQPRKAVAHYRTGVESYLLELDTLMRQHPPGPEILEERHFGTVTITPPGTWEPKRNGSYYINQNYKKNNAHIKVDSLPEPKEIELTGLLSLFELPTPVEHTFEFEHMNRSVKSDVLRLKGKAHISWQSLNRMVSAINEFVSELGLGLDVDEEDEWKI